MGGGGGGGGGSNFSLGTGKVFLATPIFLAELVRYLVFHHLVHECPHPSLSYLQIDSAWVVYCYKLLYVISRGHDLQNELINLYIHS